MTKTRLSSLDIAILARQLHSQLSGARLTNAFSIKNKQYLIRFYHFGSGKTDEEKKPELLIRAGERISLTSYTRSKTPLPDYFATVLRKTLKSAKVLRVFQVAYDRVIDIVFRVNANIYHLIFEFYAKGNIILADQNMIVINSTRHHVGHCEKGKVYRCDGLKAERTTVTKEKLDNIIANASPDVTYRNLLTQRTDLGSSVILQALRSNNIAPNSKVGANPLEPEALDCLYGFFQDCDQQIDDLLKNDPFDLSAVYKGYLYKDEDGNPDDILPFKMPNTSAEYDTYPNYSACVDAYYTHLELSKISAPLSTEELIESRLSNLNKNVGEIVTELKENIDINEYYGNVIIENMDNVSEILSYMEELYEEYGNGELDKYVKASSADFNEMGITGYNPLDKSFGLRLADNDENDVVVEIFIGMSAQSNAGYYFSLYKAAGHSLTKTQERYEIARQNVIQSAKMDAKNIKKADMVVTERRKGLWFEKFYWFISSENYLVIAGTNLQQNEVLVKNYLQPNDVYIHAAIQGAASVIIKQLPFEEIVSCYPPARAAVLKKKANRLLYHPIPAQTLNEAAQFSIAHSTFWTEELVGEIVWVWGHQVSKTAQSGEFLPAGSFMIRGERNYLKAPLPELALSFLYLVDKPREQRVPLAIELMEDDAVDPKPVQESVEIEEPQEESSESEKTVDDQQPKKHGYSAAVRRAAKKYTATGIELQTALSMAQEEIASREPRAEHVPSQKELREMQAMNDPSLSWNPKTKTERKEKRKEKRMNKKQLEALENALLGTSILPESFTRQAVLDEEIPENPIVFCRFCGSIKHQDVDCEEKYTGVADHQYYNKEKKEIAKMEAELGETTTLSADQQMTSGTRLNVLVNDITADDEIKICIPFLAPFEAVRRYPFKIKISRGDNDRSKVVKLVSCLLNSESWRKDNGLSHAVSEQLLSVPTDVLIRQMIGNIKVTAKHSNTVMQKALKKQKEAKKKAKK